MSRSGPLTVNNILVGATDVHGSSSSKPTTNTTNASLKYGTFASDPAATINSTLPVAKATWIPQQAGNYAGSSTNDTNATPISFGQMVPSPSGKISTPEAARTGGRRSRGMRHRGTPMIGGSMSVFSVRPDGPRTPTSRARGSIHSKPSRTPSGSNNKRKRSEGNASGDSESSENFTPLSQSRSGRKIVQVAQSTPVIKIEDEVKPSPKGNKKTSPTAKHASKVVEKRKSNSKKTPGGSAAVCKNCGRLHSPESNAMVFCDGCNTGWHQHCHDPPISQDIVLIESKEWFCTDCIVLKEEKSRLHGKVSGQNMSLLDKRRHLQTLSPKELVSLLLHACSVHPDLPIFNSSAVDKAAEDIYDDEDDLPYPKPGNGLVLPPEKDHLSILLDDDTDVYSHCTSGIAQLVAAARTNMLRKSTMALQQSIAMNSILVE